MQQTGTIMEANGSPTTPEPASRLRSFLLRELSLKVPGSAEDLGEEGAIEYDSPGLQTMRRSSSPSLSPIDPQMFYAASPKRIFKSKTPTISPAWTPLTSPQPPPRSAGSGPMRPLSIFKDMQNLLPPFSKDSSKSSSFKQQLGRFSSRGGAALGPWKGRRSSPVLFSLAHDSSPDIPIAPSPSLPPHRSGSTKPAFYGDNIPAAFTQSGPISRGALNFLHSLEENSIPQPLRHLDHSGQLISRSSVPVRTSSVPQGPRRGGRRSFSGYGHSVGMERPALASQLSGENLARGSGNAFEDAAAAARGDRAATIQRDHLPGDRRLKVCSEHTPPESPATETERSSSSGSPSSLPHLERNLSSNAVVFLRPCTYGAPRPVAVCREEEAHFRKHVHDRGRGVCWVGPSWGCLG